MLGALRNFVRSELVSFTVSTRRSFEVSAFAKIFHSCELIRTQSILVHNFMLLELAAFDATFTVYFWRKWVRLALRTLMVVELFWIWANSLTAHSSLSLKTHAQVHSFSLCPKLEIMSMFYIKCFHKNYWIDCSEDFEAYNCPILSLIIWVYFNSSKDNVSRRIVLDNCNVMEFYLWILLYWVFITEI